MIRIVVLFACTVLGASCSQTGSAETAMKLTGYAFPPPAFKAFCAKQKTLCSTRGATKVIKLTDARKAELALVNKSVNRRITQRSDEAVTGKGDAWNLPKNQGDCEDIAILKKSELIKRGWPASVLLLTVARSAGEGHTVLTVRTSDGDLVLDNKTTAIRNWARTPYRYFARQSQSDGKAWERIGSTP